MAENKIDVDILINTAQSAKTLGELKKAMKDLKGSINDVSDTDFNRLSQSLNDVEGKLGDMNDMAKNVSGSGIERLNASIGSLQEGLMSADPGKLSAGMKGLGAAMDAIPIFLVIEGLKYLWDNFDKVKEVLGEMFPALNDVSSATRELEAANKKATEASTVFVASLENELAIAEASGESDTKILNLKKQINEEKIKELERNITLEKQKMRDIINNDSLWESTQRLIIQSEKALGHEETAALLEKNLFYQKVGRMKEMSDKINEDQIAIDKLRTQDQVDQITFNKTSVANYEKSQEDKEKADQEAYNNRKKLKDEEAAEEKKRIEDYNKFYKDQYDQQIQDLNEEIQEEIRLQDIASRDKKAKVELDFKNGITTRQEHLEQQKQIELSNTNLTANEKLLIEQKYKKIADDDEEKSQKENAEKAFAIAQAGIQSAQAISDMIFSIKMAKAKKGSQEEEKQARAQFKVNKALSISSTVVTGAENTLKAFGSGGPLGIAKAIAVGLATTATIAKIASTQFQSTASAGGSSIGSGSGGDGGGQATPQFQAPTFFGLGQVSGTSQNNGASTQRVYVTETDISSVQNRVSVIESRARIGG